MSNRPVTSIRRASSNLQSLELPLTECLEPFETCCDCNCSTQLRAYRLNFEELPTSDDEILTLSGISDDDIVTEKLAFHQEDALELEEEAKMQQSDAAEVPPASVGQRVVMRSRLSKEDNWTGADHSSWALAGEEEILNVTKLQCEGHLPSCPQFHAKTWEKERERLNSSPHSSLDLEWENEVGLTPPQQCASAADDDFVYVPGADTCSNHSTPLSNENDLEWDGDLSSVQIGGFDMETEQLISEIEQMTADALKEPSGASR
uniref:Uncharacterized protein n=1 Tax=Amblyomma maculatum TaxID=34609 RepID=G3MKB1_AMBMU